MIRRTRIDPTGEQGTAPDDSGSKDGFSSDGFSSVEDRELSKKYQALRDHLATKRAVLVAFSGGVDSSFLLKACVDALAKNARAAIGVSPSLQSKNLEHARRMSRRFGVVLEEVETREMDNPDYIANDTDRCFHCKDTLFSMLGQIGERFGGEITVVDGTNCDDLRDFRPGRIAAQQRGVQSPLAELRWTKSEIRRASRALGLETWDRPASPCLSSRIPFGIEVTVDALRRIESAERILREAGFQEVRVRDHGDLARIEVSPDSMAALLERRLEIVSSFEQIGYSRITLDLAGYRLGGAGRQSDPGPVPNLDGE